MKYSFHFVITFFIILVFVPKLQAGTNQTEKVAQFQKYHQDNFQETIFIHTDKDYYLTGEFVKFKVYCLERLTSRPSKLSRVAYVEILDNNNIPHLQARIALNEGSGFGELYIPVSLLSGNYIIRSYTRWMRNYGPESYYHSMLTIINPFKKLGLEPEVRPEDIAIDFFPEGGILLEGVSSRMVFQGKDKKGSPTSVKGRLVADDSVEVVSFFSLKNGFGSFEFIPTLTSNYHIEVLNDEEVVSKQKFVPIFDQGLIMQVENGSSNLQVQVVCNEKAKASLMPFSLMIFQKGQMIKNQKLLLDKYKGSVSIEKALLNPGVATMCLFDSDGELLAERKIFHYHNNNPSTPGLAKNKMSNREKVEFDPSSLHLSDLGENPKLSISVSSVNQAFDDNTLDLMQYLSLDNELNNIGGLESYFNGSSEETENLINDLLIAYGKNNWNEQLAKADLDKSFIPEFRSMLVTGKILNKETKEPAAGILTYLSMPGKMEQIFVAKSKMDGSLTFEARNLYDQKDIVVQTNYTKDSIYSISIDNPYSEEYLDFLMPRFDLSQDLHELITRKSQNMQVQNANTKLEPTTEITTTLDSASFYHEPDSRYYLDDYTRFVVMEEVMREYVAGVNVRKNKEGFHFMVHDAERNELFDDNPLMILDGVAVFDADEIIALDPLKVKKIETVKIEFGRGDLSCAGIVTYATYNGNMAGHTLWKDALVMEYDGLQLQKSYKFPVYSNAFERKNTTPDLRSNLYWNPELEVSELESLEFYSSDDADQYEICINGISLDGKPFSTRQKFQVTRSKIN